MMISPRYSALVHMDSANLAVFFPFQFLLLSKLNLLPLEGAGSVLNCLRKMAPFHRQIQSCQSCNKLKDLSC